MPTSGRQGMARTPFTSRLCMQLETVWASPSVQTKRRAPTLARHTPTTPAPHPSSRHTLPVCLK
eukprot:scaffold127612_cov20-Prasinocladus_malaysianus.AAC.1